MKIRTVTCGLLLPGLLAAAVSAQQLSPPPTPPAAPAGSAPPTAPFALPLPAPMGYVGSFAWPGQGSAEAARLAHEYVKSDKEETKEGIRKKLSDLLSQQFDENSQEQQKVLDDLEQQINHLRATLKKRTERKSDIVNRRLEQLLLEADGMGWSSPQAPHAFGYGFSGQSGYGGAAVPGNASKPAKPDRK